MLRLCCSFSCCERCVHMCVPPAGYSSITAQPNDYYTTYSPSAVDFACDSYSYYLSDCSFIATYNSTCQSHQYDAYLTCVTGMKNTTVPCISGSTSLCIVLPFVTDIDRHWSCCIRSSRLQSRLCGYCYMYTVNLEIVTRKKFLCLVIQLENLIFLGEILIE